jgi:hypothetical protein
MAFFWSASASLSSLGSAASAGTLTRLTTTMDTQKRTRRALATTTLPCTRIFLRRAAA